MSMYGPFLKFGTAATYIIAMVVAGTLGFAIPHAGSSSAQPPNAEIMRRVSVTQQELSRKIDLANDALRRLAERPVQKTDESNAEKADTNPHPGRPEISKRRLDELEKQLNRLLLYVKDVEKSIAKIDTNLSTPGVLEKVVQHQKALTRP